MTPVRIPRADNAEAVVVSAAVLTHQGAVAASAIVEADDFYSATLGRLFAAATQTDVGQRRGLDRVAAVAATAKMTEDQVETVLRRAVTWDKPERWAERVADAARRRDAMRMLADAYNSLSDGAPLEDALQHITVGVA